MLENGYLYVPTKWRLEGAYIRIIMYDYVMGVWLCDMQELVSQKSVFLVDIFTVTSLHSEWWWCTVTHIYSYSSSIHFTFHSANERWPHKTMHLRVRNVQIFSHSSWNAGYRIYNFSKTKHKNNLLTTLMRKWACCSFIHSWIYSIWDIVCYVIFMQETFAEWSQLHFVLYHRK